jgi:molybdate transport system substrate-binding protein
MLKKFLLLGLMFVVMAVMAGCGGGQQQSGASPVDLTVAAAASLQDAAVELKDIYEQRHANVKITYNFASSGTLQKQIEEGAPADLFVSAGKSQMDALSAKELIVESTRKDLLGNELVLIAGQDSDLSGFEGLTDPGVVRIGIGEPETVPAGKYAKEALTYLDLWGKIETKLVLAKDVRQVLTYVETGNAEAGLVYRSDTIGSEKIKIVAAAPAGSHNPIVYPMAVVKSTKYQKEAEDLAGFLVSDEAARVFEKYGFKTIESNS